MHCRPVFTFVVLVAVCAAVVMPAARAVGEEEVTPVPEAEAADEPDIREIVANRKPIPPGTDTGVLHTRHHPLLMSLLRAIQEGDYDAFVANGTPEFTAAMAPQMLTGLHKQLGKRMDKGYAAHYLGHLRQQGNDVLLWKMAFDDKDDDRLIKLVVTKDLVAGFWLQ